MTSVEQNKSTERRIIEEVLNKGDMSLIPELVAPNWSYHNPLGMDLKGHEGFAQFVAMERDACPDIHYDIVDMFGEGDRLVVRLIGRGTFTGSMGPIKPTGNKFNVPAARFYRFEGGKEVEAIEYVDLLDFYRQMGINPPGI
jgi:predicted ester cyclase